MVTRESLIERIVEDVWRYAPVAVIAGSSMLPGCGDGYVPRAAAEKWGWEYKEREESYEESMKYRTVIDDRLVDPKNPWLVLNHMMYYLLKNKAEGEPNSKAQKFLDQLDSRQDPLHFMRDSSEVAQIYERAFIEENLRKVRETQNDFIYKHLAQDVLPQILEYGGFEEVKGLNVLGELFICQGPFKDLRKGFIPLRDDMGLGTVEGTSTTSRITFTATENRHTREYEITYAGIGPSDKFIRPTDPFVRGGFSGSPLESGIIDSWIIESRLLAMGEKRKVYIPVDYTPFSSSAIRKVGLVKLPCPNVDTLWLNDPRRSARDSFYVMEWDANRIVIDVSADVEEFVNKNGIVELDLSYSIEDLSGVRTILVEDTVHVRDRIEIKRGRGLTKRLITKPFPTSDSCLVSLVLDNGKKTLVYHELVISGPDTYPLEILSGEIMELPWSGIPYFHIGAIEKGKKYLVYFPSEGFTQDSEYRGFANFVLLPPMEKGMRSFVDTTLPDVTHLGKPGEFDPGKNLYLTKEQVVATFGNKSIGALDLTPSHPRGYFVAEIKIPEWASRGDMTLGAEFYRYVDLEAETVDKIGEAYKDIQIK